MCSCGDLMRAAGGDELSFRTPCPDFDVAALLSHLAVWVQVFDASVNDGEVEFDPRSHHIASGWPELFDTARVNILKGLTTRGIDRAMTMTATPLAGEFVLNMMLCEYIAHGWDLAMAMGRPQPFSEREATVALEAVTAILRPEYRGPNMFDTMVEVPTDAPAIDRFVGFIGRVPHWTSA